MSDPFLAEVKLFAGNFAPRDWALCQGQLLSISSNTALFSLLGTTYGGDGRTTFGLPDLRGRANVGSGHGPGLTFSIRLCNNKTEVDDSRATLAANKQPSKTGWLRNVHANALEAFYSSRQKTKLANRFPAELCSANLPQRGGPCV